MTAKTITIIFILAVILLPQDLLATCDSIISGTTSGNITISGTSLCAKGNLIGNLTNNGALGIGSDLNNDIGTLQIIGDLVFDDSSTIYIDINYLRQSDIVNVNGNITLQINSLSQLAANMRLEADEQLQYQSNYFSSIVYEYNEPIIDYVIFTTTGTISGHFDLLTDLSNPTIFAAYGRQLIYDDHSIILRMTRPSLSQYYIDDPFSVLARTDNQKTVIQAFSDITLTATGDLGSMATAFLLNSTHEKKRNYLDSMSGEVSSSLATAGYQNTQNFLDTVFANAGTSAPQGTETSFSLSGKNETARADAFGGAGQAWFSGFGGVMDVDGENGQSSYSSDSAGTIMGLNIPLSSAFTAGAAFGYGQSELSDFRGGDTASSESIMAAFTGRYMQNDWAFDGALALNRNANDTNRNITVGLISRTARADYVSYDFSAGLKASRTFDMGAYWLRPNLGANYTLSYREAYTESGAGSLNLSVEDAVFHRARLQAGMEAGSTWTSDGLNITPTLRMGLGHDVGDTETESTARFNGTAPSFTVLGATPDDLFGHVGAGVKLQIEENTDIFVDYDGLLRGQSTQHYGRGGITFHW